MRNLTRGRIFDLPYKKIKNVVLGEAYELSLVFIQPAKSRELNLAFRKKDKPTNILSFPLSKKSGEIFICPVIAAKEAPDFSRTSRQFFADLFIHGLLHLKGLAHGSKMDRQEAKIRTLFHF